MNLFYALAISILVGCGVFMILSRHVLRVILGITVLSTATNLLIFFTGRLAPTLPPIIEKGEKALAANSANALPQALVLTAIVIGFALAAFAASLVLQTYRSLRTLNTRNMDAAETLGSPFPVEERSFEDE